VSHCTAQHSTVTASLTSKRTRYCTVGRTGCVDGLAAGAMAAANASAEVTGMGAAVPRLPPSTVSSCNLGQRGVREWGQQSRRCPPTEAAPPPPPPPHHHHPRPWLTAAPPGGQDARLFTDVGARDAKRGAQRVCTDASAKAACRAGSLPVDRATLAAGG